MEMQLIRLPHHLNIIPFNWVVINELKGQVIRFTNIYIPNSNLEENRSRIFKLEWLQQLIKVIDNLNLKYSITHQDGEEYVEDRNNIKGVIFTTYKIITQDSNLWDMPHEDQNINSLTLKWQNQRARVYLGNILRAIDLPNIPKPPQKTIYLKDTHMQPVYLTIDNFYKRRQDA
ncbi:hypothetical protein BGZ63DRAFT_417240 [Mariannaea sp. PMI_226]|nr:hypothetical protein BGZ63DRAFT_417240 [Mariannaea sp. PMI_226]